MYIKLMINVDFVSYVKIKNIKYNVS